MAKNWIWHQKFYAEDAVSVSSYYNITHEPENKLFVSSFDGKGPFERSKDIQKSEIGFVKNGTLPG